MLVAACRGKTSGGQAPTATAGLLHVLMRLDRSPTADGTSWGPDRSWGAHQRGKLLRRRCCAREL